MNDNISSSRRAIFLRALAAIAFSAFAAVAARSAPIIVTDNNSTRAVAVDSLTLMRDPFQITAPGQLLADHRTRVIFFVMNLDLLAGEDARALTCDAEDGAGNKYDLKVEDVRDVQPTFSQQFGGIMQVTVAIDPAMDNAGDVLVRINLHGVASNRARISMGRVTSTPADDAGALPQPAPDAIPQPTPTMTPNPYTGPASTNDTIRFLEQATWGPTNSEVARVQAMGFRAYLNEQFSAPFTYATNTYGPADYPDLTLMPTDSSQGCPSGSAATCLRDNYTMYPLQVQFFKNALTSNDQLRQRVAWALHQIFVESGRDINEPSWFTYYLQILDRDAFGNFRTLLQDITFNPGMGRYLDTVGNSKAAPNENYAREVMQLFSVGLYQLNTDGTYKLDAQGSPVPTYDQTTVTNFARVFTGMVNAAPPAGTQGVVNYKDPMVVREANHDTATKTLLNGATLPAGQNTMTDINAGLDNIFNHPNVGPFIGRQLIQHLVTSNPSPAYVERVARAFNNDCDALYTEGCTGARGNLKAVVRAILLDPEARGDAKTDPKYGRLREPVQLVNNVLRAFNVSAFGNPSAPPDGVLGLNSPTGDLPNSLDQPVFLPPTVFSYYTPSYVVPGTKLQGPAFELLSTATALRRANAVNALVFVGVPPQGAGSQINFGDLDAVAGDPAQLVAALDARLLHNTMSPAMRSAVTSAVSAIPTTDASWQHKRSLTAIYLVASSAQYQVQR